MSSIVTEITRIPWKEYLKSQLYKIIGIIIIAILIIGVMFVSQEIDHICRKSDQYLVPEAAGVRWTQLCNDVADR